MTVLRYVVAIEFEHEKVSATAPDFPGIAAYAKSEDEVVGLVEDAIYSTSACLVAIGAPNPRPRCLSEITMNAENSNSAFRIVEMDFKRIGEVTKKATRTKADKKTFDYMCLEARRMYAEGSLYVSL